MADNYVICDFCPRLLYVFQKVMNVNKEDKCSMDQVNSLNKIFLHEILSNVEILYEKKRKIPMISFNEFTYKVNDYQFVLKSDQNYRYVVHTNFLIENCGKDKWYRFLDDRDISIQFYKVPINTPIEDIWIDDSHIIKYPHNRNRSLKKFIQILRRFGYSEDRNDFVPIYEHDKEIRQIRGINENDPIGIFDDNDSTNDSYRKTLEFPDLPINSIQLETNLLSYQDYIFTDKSKIIDDITKFLSELELPQKIQAILCFRISSQIIGK